MRIHSVAVVAMLAGLSALASAQSTTPQAAPAPAPAAPAEPSFAVPVEQLTLGKGKGGFMSVAFSTAGYNFSSSTSVQDGNERSVRVLGSTVSKDRVVVKYKVLKDGQPFESGTCAVAVRMWSGLWNQAENSLYSCVRKDGGAGPADFLLEAGLPDIAPSSKASISMREDKPVDYTVLKARMRYSGSVYQAVPTGIDPKQAERRFRAAKGWLITRDGKPVGRIDFPPRTGSGWSDVIGSYDRKSIITAPVNAADGREAVIVFAAHLLFLPEANSPILEER